MTNAQAQACASAIIGAGFNAQIQWLNSADPLSWVVKAQAHNTPIPVAAADALAQAQAVSCTLTEATFV